MTARAPRRGPAVGGDRRLRRRLRRALGPPPPRVLRPGRFDLGNMVQAVWSTAHGHSLQMTDLRGDQISRLGAHFDPILAAFAPLWWIWPSPDLLLVVQAVVVALGALPVFWLARKHLGSERAALGFALVYLLYPPTQWLTLNEFHPVALGCPLLLFAFWYLDEDRLVPFALFALLAATTKEEIGLVVAGLGIWYALAHGRRLAGGAIAVAGVRSPLIAIAVVIPHFNARAARASSRRYSAVGGSAGGIVNTALTDPWQIVQPAFTGRGLDYLLRLVLPLGLLFVSRPVAADRRAAGARAEPALGDDHADLDPLPLHGGGDPAADRGGGARRGPRSPGARPAAPGGDGGRGRRAGLELLPRRDPGLARLPRRREAAGARRRGDRARPHRRGRPAPDPGQRGRQRDELARRAPLRAAARAQLPVPRRTRPGSRPTRRARLRRPARAAADRRPALLVAAQPRVAARLRARRDPDLPPAAREARRRAPPARGCGRAAARPATRA